MKEPKKLNKPNRLLRRERTIQFLSQKELAEKASKELGRMVTERAISNIERGETSNPRVSMKRAIAQALNVPPEKLFPIKPEPEEEEEPQPRRVVSAIAS